MPALELQEFFAKIQGGDEGEVEALRKELDPVLRPVIRMRILDESACSCSGVIRPIGVLGSNFRGTIF
jgi:hypothetical protein